MKKVRRRETLAIEVLNSMGRDQRCFMVRLSNAMIACVTSAGSESWMYPASDRSFHSSLIATRVDKPIVKSRSSHPMKNSKWWKYPTYFLSSRHRQSERFPRTPQIRNGIQNMLRAKRSHDDDKFENQHQQVGSLWMNMYYLIIMKIGPKRERGRATGRTERSLIHTRLHFQ